MRIIRSGFLSYGSRILRRQFTLVCQFRISAPVHMPSGSEEEMVTIESKKHCI